MKIIIGADIVPTSSNFELFEDGNVKELIGTELKEKLDGADFIIMNLETPLTDLEESIYKLGTNLKAPSKTIKGLKLINPYFYTLANNHILDQGTKGLDSTQKVLQENGIAFSGVGKDLKAARTPYLTTINNHRIGIYCCAEHEFSLASEKSSGANPYDPLESFDDVRELKSKCDTVIVLFHGGKEHYRYPSPLIQRIFRKFADCGADFVIAQHTHCIGCKEEYNGKSLIYGQGNFLFDDSENEYWQTSLLLEININEEEKNIKYIPLKKDKNKVRVASLESYNEIMEGFLRRSSEISNKGFIEKKYSELAQKSLGGYMGKLSGRVGRNFFVRVLNKISNGKVYKSLYSHKSLAAVINCIECEAHQELILRGLKDEAYKDDNDK